MVQSRDGREGWRTDSDELCLDGKVTPTPDKIFRKKSIEYLRT